MDCWFYLSVLIKILFYMVEAGRTSKVIVRSSIGPIQGFKVLAGSSEVAVFRGIPYAEAPKGKRRFTPPVPVSTWTDIFDASHYGSICSQDSNYDNLTYRGTEDCLKLNIFKPMLFEKENTNIPVLVMIHTGNFISGSGNNINGVELAKQLESIVITLNYRLGIFGFYSMRGHIKENLGILDQIEALKWIKSNIRDFNGNPQNILMVADQVTSALHLMSPLSRILFNRVISFDGETYLNPISRHNFEFEKHRIPLENLCGRMKTTEQLPIEHLVWVCLRQAKVGDLVNLSRDLVDHFLWHPFRPVNDNHVITYNSQINSNFLHCDFMAFKSSLSIPVLRTINENSSSCEDIFKSTVSYAFQERFSNNHNLIMTILQSNYFPSFSNGSYDFCKAIEPILNDKMMSDVISFATHHSRTGLTFLNFANLWNTVSTLTVVDETKQSTHIACILTNQKAELCNLPVPVSVGVNNIVRTFLYHGYPTVNSEVVWRPFTTTSKNYLQTTTSEFRTGDSANWPIRKLENLWLDLLPEIGNAKTSSHDPEVKVVKDAVSLSWGLTEHELEALVFSLILSCLVLLCVTLTLLRIVCFVNGKTFYKKDKKQQRKDIVLTKSKKRIETSNSFNCEIFHTQDSFNLNRRTGDHTDIDA